MIAVRGPWDLPAGRASRSSTCGDQDESDKDA